MNDFKKIWQVNRQEFLDHFESDVKKGLYKKIPYADWRHLKNMHMPYRHFIITKDEFKKNLFIDNEDCTKSILHISGYDNTVSYRGLVDFILDHWGEFQKTSIPLPKSDKNITQEGEIYITSSWLDHLNSVPCDGNCWNDNKINTPTTIDSAIEQWTKNGCSDIYSYEDVVYNLKKDGYIKNNNNNKENDNMKTNDLINFEFGPVSSAQFRMSPYGIAVSTNANGWVSYNAKTGEVFNVDILNFDISKMIYKMPVSLAGIAIGDILIHSGKPVFVRAVNSNGTVSVVNYADSTVVDILPVKSPFGFNFFNKVTSLINFDAMSADADNPFGNMLPLLLFSGDNNKDFDPTMLFLFSSMNNGQDMFKNNPMAFYFLLNQKGNKDMLPFLFMMNNNNNLFGAPAPSTPKN